MPKTIRNENINLYYLNTSICEMEKKIAEFCDR